VSSIGAVPRLVTPTAVPRLTAATAVAAAVLTSSCTTSHAPKPQASSSAPIVGVRGPAAGGAGATGPGAAGQGAAGQGAAGQGVVTRPANTAASVDAAVGYLRGRTPVAVLAPKTISGVPVGGVLSATAIADATSYEISLWLCSPALPLNDAAIGSAACGGNDRFHGDFGAQLQESPAAAQAALPGLAATAPDPSCATTTTTGTVDIGAGIEASTLLCQGVANPLQAHWSHDNWDYLYDFGKTGAKGWQQILANLVVHLDTHPLPPTHGVFSVNVEDDGLHAQAAWAIGATVYTAYDGHSDASAADLVEAMQP
jgi:hypothetical protein